MRISLKVCDELAVENIIFENQGSVCKIQCSDCGKEKKLSSFLNKDTGKCTFSVSNFKRHYEVHAGNEKSTQSVENGESSQQPNENQVNNVDIAKLNDTITERNAEIRRANDKIASLEATINEKGAEILRLEAIIDGKNTTMKSSQQLMTELEVKLKAAEANLRQEVQRLESIIAEKDAGMESSQRLVTELEDKLKAVGANLRQEVPEKLVAQQQKQNEMGPQNKDIAKTLDLISDGTSIKTVEQEMFTICLSAFEEIAGPDIYFNSDKTVTFTGKKKMVIIYSSHSNTRVLIFN